MLTKHVAIGCRVVDQEDHDIRPRIPSLQGDRSLERLQVAEPRLRLDRDLTFGTIDDRIPGTEISRELHGDLVSPSSRIGDDRAKPGEQPQMRVIAHGLPVRVSAQDQASAGGGTRSTQLRHRDVRELAAFDPAELGVGHPNGPSRDRLTHAGQLPTASNLRSDRGPDGPGVAIRFCDSIASGRHDPLSHGAITPRLRSLRAYDHSALA
jgi:hypothetical protein